MPAKIVAGAVIEGSNRTPAWNHGGGAGSVVQLHHDGALVGYDNLSALDVFHDVADRERSAR